MHRTDAFPYGNIGTIKSEQEIHVLYGLSGCTLDQIVQCTHHHNSAGTLVNDKVYVHVIAALYPLGLRADTFL